MTLTSSTPRLFCRRGGGGGGQEIWVCSGTGTIASGFDSELKLGSKTSAFCWVSKAVRKSSEIRLNSACTLLCSGEFTEIGLELVKLGLGLGLELDESIGNEPDCELIEKLKVGVEFNGSSRGSNLGILTAAAEGLRSWKGRYEPISPIS